MYNVPGGKGWDFHTRPMAKNHYLHTGTSLANDTNFNYVLCQEPFSQYPIANDIRKNIGIPVIGLFHTEPYPGISKKKLLAIKQSQFYDKAVFITEHNMNSWGLEIPGAVVIPHGIDDAVFTGYTGNENNGVSIVNHFRERDVFCGWSLWERIRKEVPLKLIGENPGLSKSINDTTTLSKTLATSRFYLNTSQLSPCPLSLLEAACVGLPIISSAKQEVPKIFTHGENALLSNDPKELIGFCKRLLNDKEEAIRLGNAARKLMIEKFSMKHFVDNWSNIFV